VRLLRRLALEPGVRREANVPRKRHAPLRALVDEVARIHPEIASPAEAIGAGAVLVDGIVRTNPASLVRVGASIALRADVPMRGERKLRAALSVFGVPIAGRTVLDVGAAAGGFTRVLLAAGALRVYAVDAGHGQLIGSLRRDPHVVNLEATNLGALDRALVPDVVDVVTIDVSYLALREAVPQLERVMLAPDADAIALIKPQFELRLGRRPTTTAELAEATRRAREAFETGGWTVLAMIPSPVTGARGAVEFLLHARRTCAIIP
jgi:23S rRNA (cytidine1920-2'-O)/16S rRNA (cytidine1409-2'-O)-methyltransferase